MNNPTDLKKPAYWMPFTNTRQYAQAPKQVVKAQGMYFMTEDGRQVIDGLATLWCTNAGHCHPRIVEAMRAQIGELDFCSSFSMSHPKAFMAAERIAQIAPEGLTQVFFTNSGSEAVDTALKIALAYHRVNGQATRTRLVGRERGYHGVNFGGLSVSGIGNNRKAFAAGLLPQVDHLRHTVLKENAFSRGMPANGASLADELEERIIYRHGAENIAAVIVEPVSGAGGVLVPPQGYLQRMRELTRKHGILLIFDEVITGFGRMGTPFASQYFGVTPDLITFAKGVTSAAVPLGGVLVSHQVFDAFRERSAPGIELFHGYTYSGHPLASAAACAAIDLYEHEGLIANAAALAPHFEAGLHALKDKPHVVDVRNLQLIGAIELAPREGAAGARASEVYSRAWERGVFVRPIGDAIAVCPPLIAQPQH
ncbi:MAG: aminotransferase class III-fold pyridoxal phosphate-dependent enzyme, partial [Betaproteobacteria bacterium]|nr:aminotransferase class III-fold pyridoxal phosphate-dependent enzyme [Betaproteobacteria bacterium]